MQLEEKGSGEAGGADVVVKKEDDNADDRGLDLPSIDDTIDGGS